jgi:DedD protein
LASQIQDDGFHEIQLNGKQLVFLFMAATVVSVVIFLFGVLVGRGVKAERNSSSAETAAVATIPDATPQPPPVAAPLPAGSDPTAATPPPAVDDLSYFNRLEKPNQPEALKATPERRVAEAPLRSARPAPAPGLAAPVPVAKELAPSGAPAGDGYAIQVAALREHNEADAIANRLVSKGYGAYVVTPADGTPNVYRVRIGKFKTRREAETVASKLQKEEQFKPWITR